jgi:hypothetical protein
LDNINTNLFKKNRNRIWDAEVVVLPQKMVSRVAAKVMVAAVVAVVIE